MSDARGGRGRERIEDGKEKLNSLYHCPLGQTTIFALRAQVDFTHA